MLAKLKAKNILKRVPEVKLHLGCGRKIKPDWINIDNGKTFHNKKALDLSCNLARGIPFPALSADYIFHEHLIEHLNRKDGLIFTTECYRVLKKTGVLRIAYPDLEDAIQNYKTGYPDYEWYYAIYPKRRGLTPAEIFNFDLRENGEHRHLYDQADISKLLMRSGFAAENISFHAVSRSTHSALTGMETRSNSRCVEAVKV